MMKLSEFDYTLPKELIAQYPSPKRGEDRMLVIDKKSKTFSEKKFSDIVGYFKKGDLLVLNDTKVMRARLFGKRETGGKVEIFVLEKSDNPVKALIRSSGRIKDGEVVFLESGNQAKILGFSDIGRLVEFDGSIDEILEKSGHVPLPPYIPRPDEASDRQRYQTVYSRSEGATASPTAGLHFTENILNDLKNKGVETVFVTLHVSYGTFAPIKEENIKKHKMHSEFYHIPENSRKAIDNARKRKSRIFACGTTALRVLESYAKNKIFEDKTNLFVYPGYKFKIVDKLITNFHLPKSSLILLASAFAGKELLFKAYEYAIKNKFKFFSYGDATLII